MSVSQEEFANRPHRSMGAKLLVFLLLGTWIISFFQPLAAKPAVELIGNYSNQKTYSVTGDSHMQGYGLNLYRRGQTISGRFCVAMGIEDSCASIQNAAIDKRGSLKFKATIPIGTEISQETGPEGRTAYRFIEFRGLLKRTYISGVISSKNAEAADAPISAERIKLRRTMIGEE